MNIIQEFLNDFKNNYLSYNFQYGNSVYQGCLNDLFEYAETYNLPDCDNIQVEAKIADSTIKDELLNKYGIVLSNYLNNGLINRPTQIKRFYGKWYVSSYNSPIRIFDDNQSWVGDISPQYHNSQDGYSAVRDFDIDTTNNIIYIASYGTHTVKAFDLVTGNLIFKIGLQNQAGNLEDGRLFYPIAIKRLGNGNIIVVSRNGRGYKDGQSANGANGHVSEFDSTGNLINTRLQQDTNGSPQSGEVYLPSNIFIDEDNDDVFICYTTRGYVGRFRLSDQSYKTTYTVPQELQHVIVQASPTSCISRPSTNELIVANNNPDIIASIDLDTHDLNYYLGKTVQNDRRDQKNIIGGFYSITNFHIYDSSSYIVVDYGNNCIQIVPNMPYIDITYNFEIPSGYEIVEEYLHHINLNVNTKTRRYELDNIYKIVDVLHLPLKRVT